jgi:hypothetical protein
MAYNPTGITAQARQHPLLARTDEDRARLEAAEAKRKRKAARLPAAAEKTAPRQAATPPQPVPEKESRRADDRRLLRLERKFRKKGKKL